MLICVSSFRPVPGRAFPFKFVLVCYLVEVEKLLSIRHGWFGLWYAAFSVGMKHVIQCQLPYFASRQGKLHPNLSDACNTRHWMQRSYCIRSSRILCWQEPDKVRVTILETPETLHPLAKTTIVIVIIKDSWLAPIPKADLEVNFDVNEGKLKHYLPRFRTTFPLLRLKPQLVLELQLTPELWRVKDPKGPESTRVTASNERCFRDVFHTFWRPNMWPIEPRYVKFGEGSDWLRSDDCQVLQSCFFFSLGSIGSLEEFGIFI